ncbi:MAG: hypothetical protein J6M39_09725 [Lachnospiraceae bacterium]|nr:hypothetical protein [Lachnospiraceae bacterium]
MNISKYRKLNNIIVALVIISSILFSCAPSQKIIDNIIPDYNKRLYSIADLIPYKYKELRNAQALYGNELTDFFYSNISTDAEAKRATKKEKDAFYSELRYRNANYKLLRERLAMFTEDETASRETKEAERQKEYDEYYKLQNAMSGNIIKKYNDGKLNGMPLMSIRLDMSTATMSEVDSMYSQVDCEIYKPVVIESKVYDRLKFGDTIDLIVPATNSTIYCPLTKVVKCTYIATDSLLYKDDKGEDSYYFIAETDGLNSDVHRVLDYYGKTLETFVEIRPLQFLKYARVARANEQQRLLDAIAQENLTSYDFDKIAVRALSGGYLVYEYKDYIYANSITTNLKGYITALYNFDNQRIDNEFYNNMD